MWLSFLKDLFDVYRRLLSVPDVNQDHLPSLPSGDLNGEGDYFPFGNDIFHNYSIKMPKQTLFGLELGM